MITDSHHSLTFAVFKESLQHCGEGIGCDDLIAWIGCLAFPGLIIGGQAIHHHPQSQYRKAAVAKFLVFAQSSAEHVPSWCKLHMQAQHQLAAAVAAPGINLGLHELHSFEQVIQFCTLHSRPFKWKVLQRSGLIHIITCLLVDCTLKVIGHPIFFEFSAGTHTFGNLLQSWTFPLILCWCLQWKHEVGDRWTAPQMFS